LNKGPWLDSLAKGAPAAISQQELAMCNTNINGGQCLDNRLNKANIALHPFINSCTGGVIPAIARYIQQDKETKNSFVKRA
jgi:hypothetical protein